MKPNLFILGAPKCGTTSLADYLQQHNKIQLSNPKETGYFSKDITLKSCSIQNDTAYLNDCFDQTDKNSSIFAEGSTTYFYSENAVKKIERFSPGSKYIVMLRNPVDLVISHYYQQLKIGYENQTEFYQAWTMQEERLKGKKIPLTCEIPFNLQYTEIGFLGKYLEKIYKQVTKDRVKIIFFEDFIYDTEKSYNDVLLFLNLPTDNLIKFSIKNKGMRPKFILLSIMIKYMSILRKKTGLKNFFGVGRLIRKINNTETSSNSISKVLKNKIAQLYKEDIDKLAHMTNRNLNHWTKEY